MNTYDTSGLPLGTTAAKALYNNASNFDEAMNSLGPAFIDRFGRRRETWAGMEQAFLDFIVASGFEFIGNYDSGPLTILRANQIFSKSGEFWSAGPSLVLPYTTVNNWAIDQPKFVSRGDAVIRSDLASSNPLLGASLVNGAVRVVDTFAALAALPAAGSKYAMILGYTSAGDGAPLLTYRQNPTSVLAPNNGTVTPISGGSGNWEAVNLKDANVMSFGAVPGSSDSSVPFQNAINYLNIARVPFNVAGFTIGDLTLSANQKIIGESKVKLFAKSSANWAVRVTAFGIGTYAFIENVQFDLTAVSTAIPALLMGTSTGSVFGLRVSNVDFANCGAAYAEEVHATNWVVDVYFKDCVCFFSRGLQFFSRRSRGFFTLRDFKVDHTYNTGQVTWGGIRFDDFIGVELEKVDVVGPTQPAAVYQASAVGLQFNGALGSASIWMRRVLVDNTRGPGIGISNCHNVFGVDTCVFQNLGPAIDMTNVSKSQFVNTKVVGGVGLAAAAASANGITLTNCDKVSFNGHAVESNTGHGFVMSSCTDCSAADGYSNANSGTGYLEVTAATRNLRSNFRALSNGGGSITQLGAQSASMSYWPNSGTFVAQTAGPATIV